MFKKILSAGLVAVMSLGFATGALADSKTNDVDITVKSGEFSVKVPSIDSFGDITLKATPTTYKTSFKDKFTVKDLRGTHDGWRLDVTASQFSSGDHKLPKGSLTLKPISKIDRVGTGSGDSPKVSMSSNEVIDDGTVEVAKATSGGGMGVFDLTFPKDALSLTVDATTAKTGTYESTLTWDLVQAP